MANLLDEGAKRDIPYADLGRLALMHGVHNEFRLLGITNLIDTDVDYLGEVVFARHVLRPHGIPGPRSNC